MKSVRITVCDNNEIFVEVTSEETFSRYANYISTTPNAKASDELYEDIELMIYEEKIKFVNDLLTRYFKDNEKITYNLREEGSLRFISKDELNEAKIRMITRSRNSEK